MEIIFKCHQNRKQKSPVSWNQSNPRGFYASKSHIWMRGWGMSKFYFRDWHSCIDITARAYVWIAFSKPPKTMKMSITKKKWKSVYEMYLKDMQAHSHHPCILSRHVKGYENFQCAADRNFKTGANAGSTSGTATAGQGKGLQLFSSGCSAGAAGYCLVHFRALFPIQEDLDLHISCAFTQLLDKTSWKQLAEILILSNYFWALNYFPNVLLY